VRPQSGQRSPMAELRREALDRQASLDTACRMYGLLLWRSFQPGLPSLQRLPRLSPWSMLVSGSNPSIDGRAREGLMRSSWFLRGDRSPRTSLIIGCVLLAVGLWGLFFVLFRTEGVLFTVAIALILLGGSFNIWRAAVKLRHPGLPPSS